MANKQINELSELTSPATGDLIPIYDIDEAGSEKTKKVTASHFQWTYESMVATTAGTSHTLTSSIPSWATEIEVIIDEVSTNTTGQGVIIQLGDSGGIETTGYNTILMHFAVGSNNIYDRSNCFGTVLDSAVDSGDQVVGVLKLTRWDPSEHKWIATGWFGESITAGEHGTMVVGNKILSDALTTIRITTPGGTATFDAGQARVKYR